MNTPIPYFGETLALAAAVAWALAVILFKKSGETVHPIALNLFKVVFALVLFLATIWIWGEALYRLVPAQQYGLLLLSGALGIGISDTLFFKSLNLLGAGLSAIVDCLYSPFIITLSIFWLDERLSILQAAGVLLIVSAVLTATSAKGGSGISGRDLRWGIFWGVLAMASLAVSIVMIKPLLESSPILWVTEIRLGGGLVILMPMLLLHPSRKRILASMFSRGDWIYTLCGSFMGTYLALLFWLGGMKYTLASTAAALNQTSNIFVFVFAALLLKEVINLRRTVGIVLGVTGAFLVTFG